jgi:hypothetical protein
MYTYIDKYSGGDGKDSKFETSQAKIERTYLK